MNVELDSFDFFAFDKMGSAMLFFLPKPTEWAPCAAILSMMVDSQESAEGTECFGKMKVSDADLAELTDAAANDGKDNALVFPGISVWKSAADQCNTDKGAEAFKTVEFTLKGAKVYKAGEDFVIDRKSVV